MLCLLTMRSAEKRSATLEHVLGTAHPPPHPLPLHLLLCPFPSTSPVSLVLAPPTASKKQAATSGTSPETLAAHTRSRTRQGHDDRRGVWLSASPTPHDSHSPATAKQAAHHPTRFTNALRALCDSCRGPEGTRSGETAGTQEPPPIDPWPPTDNGECGETLSTL